jgi:farnesyl-diphosphate farnesyltransferase
MISVKRQYALTMPPTLHISPAQRQLLRSVSRSFDLSIRLLPAAVRAPVAVGYLLARATDTVADTTALPAPERLALLSGMSQAIQSPAGTLHGLQPLLAQFASHQTDPHERALMQALPQCLPMLHALPPADQASVRWVLSHITHGQVLDIERFGPGLNALDTQQALDDYTWLVAGCVGEFWTQLCERHLPDFANQPVPAMHAAGRQYGMGLQRLNILRDAGADLAAGRCYLPAERLSALGLSPESLAQAAQTGDARTLHKLTPLWDEYLQQTQDQLSQGLFYSQALTQGRLRLASALPALIGARTVALLRQAGTQALTQRVKMPRREVHHLLVRLICGFASPNALGREFIRLSTRPSP